jgi:hypothetical protein
MTKVLLIIFSPATLDHLSLKWNRKTPILHSGIKKSRQTYEREDPKESSWYRLYITRPVISKKALKIFRRAFRLPHKSFVNLVLTARQKHWFPKREQEDAAGLRVPHLNFLSWVHFDILDGVGSSTTSLNQLALPNQTFFYEFVKVIFSYSNKMFKDVVILTFHVNVRKIGSYVLYGK